MVSQTGSPNQTTSQPVSTAAGPLALVPQPTKDKFETMSTAWADTLSRGLVNLNISGSKTNPLADIGIDFDAINRKEKRMEKPAATPAVSSVTRGKAMGSGSGIGRSGASALRLSASPMMNSGLNTGIGAGPGYNHDRLCRHESETNGGTRGHESTTSGRIRRNESATHGYELWS